VLEEIVDKYAGLLDGRDISTLFNRLRGSTSRSQAARLCELERRTTYYWTDSGEVRLLTKRRVLQANLEKDFSFTLRYLCDRTTRASIEIIRLYVGALYEKAMDPELNRAELQKSIKEFCAARTKYSPVVGSSMTPDIGQMTVNLKNKSEEMRIDFPVLPISNMNVNEMVSMLPQLVKIVPVNLGEDDLQEISRRYGIADNLVKFASVLKTEAIQFARSFRRGNEAADNQYIQVQKEGPTTSNQFLRSYKKEENLGNPEIQSIPQIGSQAPQVPDYIA